MVPSTGRATARESGRPDHELAPVAPRLNRGVSAGSSVAAVTCRPARGPRRGRLRCCGHLRTGAGTEAGPLRQITRPMTVIARRPWVAAVALCSIALAGCQTDHQAAGDRLVRDLSAKYPGQINAIEFKYAPPLDPPTLYIDLDASMDPQAQRRFLCEVLVPDMSVVDRDHRGDGLVWLVERRLPITIGRRSLGLNAPPTHSERGRLRHNVTMP